MILKTSSKTIEAFLTPTKSQLFYFWFLKIIFMKKYLLMVTLLTSLISVRAQHKISHQAFGTLHKKYVSATGKVNYKAFKEDSINLNGYLNLLSKNPPDKTWSREQQIAYWINAYNAFTIKLIIKYYPIKSIKDIGSSIQLPFVNTPWDLKFIKIGNEIMDLNHIEHGILRKEFYEPRIHMALVCASKSCPTLLNEAFVPEKLEQQLVQQTKMFLSDSFRNKISAENPQLSMIFNWYGADFSKNGGSVRSFVNTYSAVKIKPNAKISYLEYDWSLNE